MKEKSLESSEAAAVPVKEMMKYAQQLDVEYLTECLNDMKKNHSFRENAAVLNPNPFLHNEQQDLNSAKMKQLELFLDIAKNIETIKQCELSLIKAKQNSNQLKNIFGHGF